MAVTRKFLKGISLSDEQVEAVIEAHTEVVDGLKEQASRYKADADALAKVQKELDALKANNTDSWKVKYDALKEDYENFKSEQAQKESRAAKETAFRDLLKEVGVAEKRIDAVVKVSDVDSIELDAAGKIKDLESLTENVKAEWADFIVTQERRGADTPKPPANTGTREAYEAMSLADKMRYANEHPQEVAGWSAN